MFKLALGAFISLLFVLTPAEAAKVEQRGGSTIVKKSTVKKSAAKKQRYKRKEAVSKRVTVSSRGSVVRRVITLKNGKRKVVHQRVYTAAPVIRSMTAGDKAGLNLTRDPLALASSVALVLDQTNSEVLFEKNANVALPIASITKLMTGLIVVEAQQDMDEMLTITDDDVDREKFTTSRLRVGARLSRRELLHIALMSSENRAAAALGRNYPGGIHGFVAKMNEKAHELGMSDTHYVDSSGLSSRNVASARDLAKLVMVAHQQPLLREFSTDPGSVVAASGRPVQYRNTNKLVSLPDWDIGLQKTGFINEAGRCLVMQTIIQGRAVIMVFLDSKGKQSRTADAGRMRRWLEALKPPGLS
ncbi:D-alanyl-D-alanine endopeptidase [Massilia cavernae]|uniref:D-alanyl-D-alanine endopeptidase n=1 Tax=Massilia cavernae TaxID=2320864 RepID=A0A418XQ01_9BURK|nr:D-alanyl-D-alanine endopeptidase [Massilia cavernae]RJG14534.1 D-alanyl-D-alanine endopeptidase [Massilia cavernae]